MSGGGGGTVGCAGGGTRLGDGREAAELRLTRRGFLGCAGAALQVLQVNAKPAG